MNDRTLSSSKPLFNDSSIVEYAHYKRLRERYLGDPDFAVAVGANPNSVLHREGLLLPGRIIRELSTQLAAGNPCPFDELDLLFPFAQSHDPKQLEADYPISSISFRAWRDRQIQRLRSQFTLSHHNRIQSIVCAFELSQGCSGQCPFCCMDAEPYIDSLKWNDRPLGWWRDILLALREVLGPHARFSAGFWATDPFDNPDYELFSDLFCSVNGGQLYTTTMMWDQNIERVRSFIRLQKPSNKYVTFRLSVISLKQLRHLHATFTPEELVRTPVSLHNKESVTLYSPTGRMRGLVDQETWRSSYAPDSTSACLNGLLLNLQRGTVELVSPCPPTDVHPKGYMVFEKRRFTDGDSLAEALKQLVKRNMPLRVAREEPLRLRDDLDMKVTGDGLAFTTRYLTKWLKQDPLLPLYGKMLQQGSATLAKLQGVSQLHPVSSGHADKFVDYLFRHGFLSQSSCHASRQEQQTHAQ